MILTASTPHHHRRAAPLRSPSRRRSRYNSPHDPAQTHPPRPQRAAATSPCPPTPCAPWRCPPPSPPAPAGTQPLRGRCARGGGDGLHTARTCWRLPQPIPPAYPQGTLGSTCGNPPSGEIPARQPDAAQRRRTGRRTAGWCLPRPALASKSVAIRAPRGGCSISDDQSGKVSSLRWRIHSTEGTRGRASRTTVATAAGSSTSAPLTAVAFSCVPGRRAACQAGLWS